MTIPTLPPTTDLPRFITFEDCEKGQTAAKTGCTPQEGGGGEADYTPKYTDGSKSKDTLLDAFDNRGDAWDALTRKEKKEASWLDYSRRKEREDPEERRKLEREREKAQEEKEKLYSENQAWIRKQGTDSIANDVGSRLEGLGFTVEISGYEGDSKYISVYSDGDYVGDVRVSDHPSPPGGGYSPERGNRHGEADVSIDPEKGIDIDSAIDVIVKNAE